MLGRRWHIRGSHRLYRGRGSEIGRRRGFQSRWNAGSGSGKLPRRQHLHPAGEWHRHLGAATDVAVGDRPESVVVADFKGNGALDLAVAVVLISSTRPVSVSCWAGHRIPLGAHPLRRRSGSGGLYLHSVAAVDLDGDGILDLIGGKGGTGARSNNVSVFLGNGTGSFSPVIRFAPVDGAPASVAVGELSGNRKPDIARRPDTNVAVLLNATP